jgi:hypothetical protein
MELGTAKVLAQIKGAKGCLEAKRKDSLPLLPPVLLWRVAEAIDQNWLANHCHVTGEVLPLPHKDLLTQHMRSDAQGQ